VYRVFVRNLKERDHLEDHVVDVRMGSEWLAGGVEWFQLAIVNIICVI
jgi:hypothetical protein